MNTSDRLFLGWDRALLLTLAGAIPWTALQAAQPPRPTSIPCPAGVPAGEVEGKTVQCGVVAVPENHQHPDGRQIDLTYAVFKSRSLSPQPDPVIVLHGGPAQNAIPNLTYFMPLVQRQRQTRDVILFDQRGSALSGELSCFPSRFALDEAIKPEGSPWAAQYAALRERLRNPVDPDDEFLLPMYLCARSLKMHGADLDQYRTTASAHDVALLATALGHPRVNLYGFSYGTYLAQRVMREHPQRLRSVVLDSTLPQQAAVDKVTLSVAENVLLNLMDDCQHDAACRAAYPGLKARSIALVNRLATQPMPRPAGGPAELAAKPVSAEDLLQLLLSMNQDPRVAPYVPRAIAELERGQTTTLDGLKTGSLFAADASLPVAASAPSDASQLLRKASELRAEARRLLAEQTRLPQTGRPSQQWLQTVLDAIEALPEPHRTAAKVNLHGVGYQSGLPRNRAALQTLVDEDLPQARATLLPALLALDGAEVRHVFELISDTQHRLSPLDGAVAFGAYRSIQCADQMPAASAPEVEATYARLQMPALARMTISAARQSRPVCALWPVRASPARDREPLRSAVPTLVLQGRYDMQTGEHTSRRVLEGLHRAHWVLMPNSGHGVFLHSACARDVAAAFIDNPGTAPDARCSADMVPHFKAPTP